MKYPKLQIRVTTEELAAINEARGSTPISEFIKNRLFDRITTPIVPPPPRVEKSHKTPGIRCRNSRCHRMHACTCGFKPPGE